VSHVLVTPRQEVLAQLGALKGKFNSIICSRPASHW
jgi:hypothetical protein